MSLFLTLLIFLFSIFITQLISFNKPFYTRFLSFILINLFLFLLLSYYFKFDNFLIYFLLTLSLIFSWAGFITHISNSIFFSLLKIINENKIKNFNNLETTYNIKKKYQKRLKILLMGNYLKKNNKNYSFNRNVKNIIIIKTIISLRKG